MKKLPKLENVPDELIVKLLKKYIGGRIKGYTDVNKFICKFLYLELQESYLFIHEYIEKWRIILYPKNENSRLWGIFGKPSQEQNDERIVFCLQIITELENKTK